MSIVLQFHRRCHVFRRCRLNHQRSRDDPPPPTITNKNSSISSSNNNTAISRLTLLPRRMSSSSSSSCTRTRLTKAPQTISPVMFCTYHYCCTLHAFAFVFGKNLSGKQPRRRASSQILRQLTTTGNSDSSSTSQPTARTATATTKKKKNENKEATIVVAMSGGVDSSVAAALLLQQQQQQQQHSVTSVMERDSNNNNKSSRSRIVCVHMTNWNTADDDSVTPCSSEQDWEDTVAAATHLGLIDYCRRIRSLESVYWTQVFEPFLDALQSTGQMGNPDVACNQHVKFGALVSYCREQYGENTVLATGHYARLWHRKKKESLPKGSGKSNGNTNDNDDDDEERRQRLEETIRRSLLEHDRLEDFDWLDRQWGMQEEEKEEEEDEYPERPPSPILLAAADPTKDQSYFLAGCDVDQFANVIFPLGDLHKKTKSHPDFISNSTDRTNGCVVAATKRNENNKNNSSYNDMSVRQLAANFGLPTAAKRESMGICFVGKRPGGFRSFLEPYLPVPDRPVEFVNIETGQVIHRTLENEHACTYTIGQGAKLSGQAEKFFCCDRILEKNRVVVCAGTHHPALYSDALWIHRIHFMARRQEWPQPLQETGRMRVQCRIRHLQPLVWCEIIAPPAASTTSTTTTATWQVVFDKPIRGITAGQMAVFYLGLVCLGSGTIHSAGPTYWEQGKDLSGNTLHPAGHNDLSV